jgi:hypothetical protein
MICFFYFCHDGNTVSTLFSRTYDNVGSAVADSVGDAFQPRYIPQRTPQGTSQYYTSPIHRPLPTMDDQSSLSQEKILKIEELKRLVYKYRQYHNNDPDEIVKWAINGALKGDNQFLDKKLEQPRIIDFYKG